MTSNEPVTVLITGVGDTVGQALIKAARMSSIPCRVVGTDRNELCVGLHHVDRGFVLPSCAQADLYLREMSRVCRDQNVRLILPGSEKELEVLTRHADALRSETGAIVVASPPDVVRVALSKWETCRFLKQAGLNYPQFARLDDEAEVEELVRALGFPLIAKPIYGTGSRGLLKIQSWDDLAQARSSGTPLVLQEFLPDEEQEYSVEVYTLKDGRQAGSVCYRRGQLVAGDTFRAHVVVHEAVQAEARRVAAALRPFGPCNVQLRVTERGPVTFEINLRFSGGVSIRAHFGYNEVEMAIRDLVLGQEVPEPTTRTGAALRYWEEMYFDDPHTVTNTTALAHPAAGMEILSTDDRDGWLAVLGQEFQHDFHHLPQFHRIAEHRCEGVAHLFTYREAGYVIALPLLLRPVTKGTANGWYDATSVYGYAGPIASHASMPEPVIRHFQESLRAALTERSVIAVFSRLHPLIAQQEFLVGLGECRPNGQTVSIDLTQPLDEQWAQYHKNCRRDIRKLREDGFVGLHDAAKRYLPEMISIYRETMQRAGASAYYYWDERYFHRLVDELGPVLQLFVAMKDGVVVAASMATICHGFVQDFLGGTRSDFLAHSPDRLVVDTERLWATEQGASVLHLGGGVGGANDSLFRYKSSFSSRRHPFFTWRWVLRPDVYQSFCEAKARFDEQNSLQCSAPDYFPAYRAPTAPA